MEKTMNPGDLQKVIMLGILIAIQLVLGRFAIGYKIVRIDFTFIPLFLMGKWYGSLWTGMACALSDVIGSTLINGTGYLPQFTISAVLAGLITGWFFYHHSVSWPRVILYQLTITIFIDLILNTYWVYLLNPINVKVLISMRLVKELISAPIQILIIHWLGNNRAVKQMTKRLI